MMMSDFKTKYWSKEFDNPKISSSMKELEKQKNRKQMLYIDTQPLNVIIQPNVFTMGRTSNIHRQQTSKRIPVIQKHKSKLPLFLSTCIIFSLIATSLVGLPPPYSYIMTIALSGPLSASILGLRK